MPSEQIENNRIYRSTRVDRDEEAACVISILGILKSHSLISPVRRTHTLEMVASERESQAIFEAQLNKPCSPRAKVDVSHHLRRRATIQYHV